MSTSHITNRTGKRTHLSHRLADCWGVFAAAKLGPEQAHSLNARVQSRAVTNLPKRCEWDAGISRQLLNLCVAHIRQSSLDG